MITREQLLKKYPELDDSHARWEKVERVVYGHVEFELKNRRTAVVSTKTDIIMNGEKVRVTDEELKQLSVIFKQCGYVVNRHKNDNNTILISI